jgi:hypothetical protein
MDRNIGSTFSAPSCAEQQRQINAILHTIESWYDNKIHKKNTLCQQRITEATPTQKRIDYIQNAAAAAVNTCMLGSDTNI